MTIPIRDRPRPETIDEKTRGVAAFIVVMSFWLPVLGVLAGWMVQGFIWATGL